jgi:hypothetical protein
MLLNNTHVPNAATQQFVSDVVSDEVAASGVYSAGGVAIAGKVSMADGNNYSLNADDLVLGPGTTLNYRYGILFKDTGNQATSPIRAQIDFLTDQIVTNGTSTIQWNALGIIYLS